MHQLVSKLRSWHLTDLMEEFESFVKESLKIPFRWQVQETSIFVLKLQNSQIMAQLQGDQNGENPMVEYIAAK